MHEEKRLFKNWREIRYNFILNINFQYENLSSALLELNDNEILIFEVPYYFAEVNQT